MREGRGQPSFLGPPFGSGARWTLHLTEEDDSMRKKLVLLGLALAAAIAAGTMAPAAAAGSTCPKNTHPIDCGTYILCCPDNAFCVCGP